MTVEIPIAGEGRNWDLYAMTVAPEAPLPRPPASRLLDAGDTAPIVHAPDHTGHHASTGTDQLAGKPILLLFCPVLDEPSLIAFRACAAELATHACGSVRDQPAGHRGQRSGA